MTDREGADRNESGAASTQSRDMLPLAHEPDTTPAECAQVAQALWDFLDGRVEPAFEHDLRRHIAVCEPCLRYAEFQRHLTARMASESRVSPRPETRRRILAALCREGFAAVRD